MKFRMRFADKIVGAFVLIGIVGIAVILIFIGLNQRLFAKNYYFLSRFSSAEGLSIGMPITLNGFAIGKISRISLNAQNEADMKFYVEDTYYSKVLPFSVLELVSSPIGLGTSLRFHPGRRGGPPLPEQSFVPSLNSPEGREYVVQGAVEMPGGEDVIGSVMEKINPVLDEARLTLAQVRKVVSDVDLALEGKGGPMGTMVSGFAATPAKINRAIDGVNQTLSAVSGKTDSILASLDSVMKNLDEITADLKVTSEGLREPKGLVTRLIDPKGSIATLLDDQNALYNQIQDAIANVNRITAEFRKFAESIGSAGPQISGILEKGDTVLEKGGDVLEAAKNNPLLKGGIPPKKPQGPTMKSYRDEDF